MPGCYRAVAGSVRDEGHGIGDEGSGCVPAEGLADLEATDGPSPDMGRERKVEAGQLLVTVPAACELDLDDSDGVGKNEDKVGLSLSLTVGVGVLNPVMPPYLRRRRHGRKGSGQRGYRLPLVS